MRRVATAVLTVLLVLMTLPCLDAVARLWMTGRTEFTIVESSQPQPKTLFVCLPGILAEAKIQSAEILPVFQQQGDVLLVDYAGKRFDGGRTATNVSQAIIAREASYQRIVLVGVSLGGLVAYDTYQHLKDVSPSAADKSNNFLLVDAPTGRSDLQAPLDTTSLTMKVWYPGPLANLLRAPIMGAMFRPPKPENIEPGVDQQKLAAAVKSAKSFPPSEWADEIRYVIGHGPLRTDSLVGARVVYVRSMRDNDTVRPLAYINWLRASGYATYIEVDSAHAAFNEMPNRWRGALEGQVLPVLGFP